ncbi:unnamed protein product [Parnassius apollo]|uniref:(apollo) hypothetical protein n=1 Tax=Parnassius apollo TaxID=110799 RepID=A0A8S3WZL1_PARAO|nr:unnamed protein product [Parnassius apollo]
MSKEVHASVVLLAHVIKKDLQRKLKKNLKEKRKWGHFNEREECKKLKEINTKLETDIKEARELEKSHRFHLQNSREMIGNLQETISQLVYLKRDVKRLKEEIIAKDTTIVAMEKDKEAVEKKQNEILSELRSFYEQQIEEIKTGNERKLRQVQHDSDTQIAQFTFSVAELRSKLNEVEAEHRDKKLQELEEKLKQSQFKEYLAQSSYSSQLESGLERPYSVSREIYTDTSSVDLYPVPEGPKQLPKCIINQNKVPRATNTLQVTYSGSKTSSTISSNEKKGQFNITKKRKLYTEKDFQGF